MTEFKVGDRVLYKGYEGTIISRKGQLYEVRFDDAGFYLYTEQIKPIKEFKGCIYCEHKEPLNDVPNSCFALVIDHDENDYHIDVEYYDDVWSDNERALINYCPICGRRLEVPDGQED